MKPLVRAYVPETEIQKGVTDLCRMVAAQPEMVVAHLGLRHGASHIDIRNRCEEIVRAEIAASEIWKNDVYQVAVRRHDDPPADELPRVIHLSIKRLDKEPVRDWRDMQEIKNQLVGPEYEAVELYPAESRKVDTANQYHLWVLADPTMRFPLGFAEGLVADHIEGSASKQRAMSNRKKHDITNEYPPEALKTIKWALASNIWGAFTKEREGVAIRIADAMVSEGELWVQYTHNSNWFPCKYVDQIFYQRID